MVWLVEISGALSIGHVSEKVDLLSQVSVSYIASLQCIKSCQF